jgi:hypothetical protein
MLHVHFHDNASYGYIEFGKWYYWQNIQSMVDIDNEHMCSIRCIPMKSDAIDYFSTD